MAAFLASGLTLFSGFGLGTILMPVVALFLPVPVAVAVTAIAHFVSKVVKLLLFLKDVDIKKCMAFGIPAVLAAIPGALALQALSGLQALGGYTLHGHWFEVTPLKLTAGMLLVLFATAESVPFFKAPFFGSISIRMGGALSGFFGGLTGHQGAFRSAFLVQGNISERSFIATNAAVAAMVDATRLTIYGITFNTALVQGNEKMAMAASIAAFLGVTLAAGLVKKVTIRMIQFIITLMMYLFGALLCLGIM